jgi:hypothetical protein
MHKSLYKHNSGIKHFYFVVLDMVHHIMKMSHSLNSIRR